MNHATYLNIILYQRYCSTFLKKKFHQEGILVYTCNKISCTDSGFLSRKGLHYIQISFFYYFIRTQLCARWNCNSPWRNLRKNNRTRMFWVHMPQGQRKFNFDLLRVSLCLLIKQKILLHIFSRVSINLFILCTRTIF